MRIAGTVGEGDEVGGLRGRAHPRPRAGADRLCGARRTASRSSPTASTRSTRRPGRRGAPAGAPHPAFNHDDRAGAGVASASSPRSSRRRPGPGTRDAADRRRRAARSSAPRPPDGQAVAPPAGRGNGAAELPDAPDDEYRDDDGQRARAARRRSPRRPGPSTRARRERRQPRGRLAAPRRVPLRAPGRALGARPASPRGPEASCSSASARPRPTSGAWIRDAPARASRRALPRARRAVTTPPPTPSCSCDYCLEVQRGPAGARRARPRSPSAAAARAAARDPRARRLAAAAGRAARRRPRSFYAHVREDATSTTCAGVALAETETADAFLDHPGARRTPARWPASTPTGSPGGARRHEPLREIRDGAGAGRSRSGRPPALAQQAGHVLADYEDFVERRAVPRPARPRRGVARAGRVPGRARRALRGGARDPHRGARAPT